MTQRSQWPPTSELTVPYATKLGLFWQDLFGCFSTLPKFKSPSSTWGGYFLTFPPLPSVLLNFPHYPSSNPLVALGRVIS